MLPKTYECYKPILELLADGKEHTREEIIEHLARYFNVTEQERRMRLQSGNDFIFINRIGWAIFHLRKASAMENSEDKKGIYRITQLGLDILEKNPEVIDYKYLNLFAGKSEESNNNHSTEQPPEEIIAVQLEILKEKLKDELRQRILEKSPHFFEKLVLELIVKMGYGGSFEEASKVLGKSGDEGIDGVIKEDVLGLDNIYLQAKRYNPGQSIGRKEIQSFVGALHGKGARKGIFITTASFTKEALQYAENIKDIKVVLIDGDKLLDYMIKYNLGVRVDSVIEIKKIDSDYFEEE
ncbi:MAG: restriction endonuclease [Fervidobacterium sp.]|uniref:Restriction endonuclease n=1 Tax=Fervidobacterium pennivorans TaxID=93466 RepID=A0A7C4W4N3_FERPE|nr:restriction endonuclease [Fervidobacterium pennivorans]MDM7320267.1 restriction endonuclease [Fervidobacterium sp.]QIV77994.1 restriction endonuclease [Fervidobacterium pennivorans subsp. keratinolyticus]